MMMMNRRGLMLVLLVLWGHTASAGLSRKQQKALLKQHNQFRSKETRASNMMELVWSKDLARRAQNWADRCTMDHNPVRSLGDWAWVGENLAFSSSRSLQEMAGMWEAEKAIFDFDSNRCSPVPGNKLLKSCGHYKQMVWGDTAALGCGFALCQGTSTPRRLVCNYGEGGNWPGEKPYSTGRRCSDCPNKYKKCSNGLCSK